MDNNTDEKIKTAEFMAVATEKLGNIEKSSEKTEKHLEKLNGKVAINSRWRHKLTGSMIVIVFLFPLLTAVFGYFMKDMKQDMVSLIEAKSEKIDYNKINNHIDEYVEANYLTQ